MSAKNEGGDVIICCASCGSDCVAKLKSCEACYLVQYCSDKCRHEHRPKHERVCKIRAGEIRDELLFKLPESSHLGDCPICLLPLSINIEHYVIQSCCSKWICNGCAHANRVREMEGVEEIWERKCPFCREPMPATNEEGDVKKMKRVERNDPVAICEVGKRFYHDGDHVSAFEYLSKAAGLGNPDGHYNLAILYREGNGVEKNDEKYLYHLEEAAIAGQAEARHDLANYEGRNGRKERAVRHLIIAANLGHDMAIKKLQFVYAEGMVGKDVFSKEDFAAALRAYQTAVNEAKSPQREEAEKPWQPKPLDRIKRGGGGGKSSKQGKQLEKKVTTQELKKK